MPWWHRLSDAELTEALVERCGMFRRYAEEWPAWRRTPGGMQLITRFLGPETPEEAS